MQPVADGGKAGIFQDFDEFRQRPKAERIRGGKGILNPLRRQFCWKIKILWHTSHPFCPEHHGAFEAPAAGLQQG